MLRMVGDTSQRSALRAFAFQVISSQTVELSRPASSWGRHARRRRHGPSSPSRADPRRTGSPPWREFTRSSSFEPIEAGRSAVLSSPAFRRRHTRCQDTTTWSRYSHRPRRRLRIDSSPSTLPPHARVRVADRIACSASSTLFSHVYTLAVAPATDERRRAGADRSHAPRKL